MGQLENELWIESAVENFDTALSQGDYKMAEAIIADAREKGFEIDAEVMENDLKKSKDSQNPDILSNVILSFLKKQKKNYEDKGMIPTLELLIEDMENNLKR